jgi:hypothetical protein
LGAVGTRGGFQAAVEDRFFSNLPKACGKGDGAHRFARRRPFHQARQGRQLPQPILPHVGLGPGRCALQRGLQATPVRFPFDHARLQAFEVNLSIGSGRSRAERSVQRTVPDPDRANGRPWAYRWSPRSLRERTGHSSGPGWRLEPGRPGLSDYIGNLELSEERSKEEDPRRGRFETLSVHFAQGHDCGLVWDGRSVNPRGVCRLA